MFLKRVENRASLFKKVIRFFGYTVAFFFIISLFSNSDNDSDKIHIIPITGNIFSGSNGFSSSDTYSDDITAELILAENDPSVKAIILEIDSPGGTVVGSREISNAVSKINKPVIAWLRETAASGAYWVAVSSDFIIADPATITGSIGVTGSYLQFSELLDKYGISYERFVSGNFKDTGSPYREISTEERAYLQNKINLINDMFIDHVATSRNLSRSFVRQRANGQVFLGTEALNNKLIDYMITYLSVSF